MKKVLITGVAGFIGFSLANRLLKLEKNTKVYGIDNFDNYYSVKIKKKRVLLLKKNRNFFFSKIDISKKNQLSRYLRKKKFEYIFHFAAQAGVRYSFKNPIKYVNTNINGFVNLIESLKFKPNYFFYASSSSVYGDLEKYPTKESYNTFPLNIYGISKVINEIISKHVSKDKKINFIGLRFYTVFGPWGRPDMFLLKIFDSIYNKKVFELNNFGNHERDFTYIDDVIDILVIMMKKKFKKTNNIFNICSNRPQNIMKLTDYIYKNIGKFKFKKIIKHNADVLKTHGNNSKILGIIGKKKFKNIDEAIELTHKWYKENKIYKLK